MENEKHNTRTAKGSCHDVNDLASRANTFLENPRTYKNMRLRSSFKSDVSYHTRRRQTAESQLTSKMAQMSVQGKNTVGSIYMDKHGNDEGGYGFRSSDNIRSRDEDSSRHPQQSSSSHRIIPGAIPARMLPVGSPTGHNLTPSSPSHHHRSNSCRTRRPRTREAQFFEEHEPRQRTYSMPSRSRHRRPKLGHYHDDDESSVKPETSDQSSAFYRVRTFSTSGKGIVNRGDSFKRKPVSTQASLEGDVKGSSQYIGPTDDTQTGS